jgi:peptide deformylase
VQDIHTATVQQVIADLLTTIVADGRGIGLAAPQIGESYRIFAVKKPLYRNEHELRQAQAKMRRGGSAFRKAAAEKAANGSEGVVVAVNPRVTQSSAATELGIESCLSVPDYPALVRRASRIEVEYTDQTGQLIKEQLHGAPAVVFQHELDHLDGLLHVDREVTITARPIEEEIELAQEKWYLDVMKFYGKDNLD